MVSGLLGQPEAEEVRSQDGVVGLLLEEQPPVIGARGKAMQKHQKGFAAAAFEDVDPAIAKLLI
jgi:hypothetical protein